MLSDSGGFFYSIPFYIAEESSFLGDPGHESPIFLAAHSFLSVGIDIFLSLNDAHISLAPSPNILAIIAREGHQLEPLVIPGWSVSRLPHVLCPVAVFRQY